MRAVTDDAEVLAVTELRFLIDELLARGRRQDGQKVTAADLIASGVLVQGEH
ncbi:MAG: hypothetical protein HYZ29_11780 [Myxococcales bacterium]|nr:hypothetical protein [Myxococcales bacterium]